MRVFQHEWPNAGPTGRASLVGAGPGDPELLTIKAAKAIAAADVILYDRLVGAEILAMASPGARCIDVGKRCGQHSMKQAEINDLIVAHARQGAYVVRLKGGDPFVFGRGGEELNALQEAGIAVDVIPGITAACAAAASLRMPLTHRDMGRSLHLVSGHGAEGGDVVHDWAALARPEATLVLYMGARRLGSITAQMIDAGVPADLPAVAVANASLPNQRHCVGDVGTIAAVVEAEALDGPIILVFGKVVGFFGRMDSMSFGVLHLRRAT